MATLKMLVNRYNVRIDCEYVGYKAETEKGRDVSPYSYSSRESTWYYNEWKCVLRMGKRQMTIPAFKMGVGLTGEPSAYDVLYSVISDAQSIEYYTFEGWCNEYGYDTDSRKAERMYHDCERENEQLKKFLGERYDEFMRAEQD